MKARIYLVLLLLLVISSEKATAQETITIDCAETTEEIKHLHGLLLGTHDAVIDAPTDSLLGKTNPKFWRSRGHIDSCFNIIVTQEVSSMVVLSDLYQQFKGGYENAKPWLNWAEYEAFVDTIIQLYAASSVSPAYWDIWNEPDGWTWSGTSAQYVECIVRTINVIRARDPDQKIAGPGLINYNNHGILYLVDTLQTLGLHLDAVNWHEFYSLYDTERHIKEMRDSLDVRPYAENVEIQITEYSGPENAQVPGSNVGYLNAFENSPVDWVNKACWDYTDGVNSWSSCWQGYNGLFWHDETSPLPLYWTLRAYAALQGSKLGTTSTDSSLSAIACNDLMNTEIRVLVGRHQSNLWNAPAPDKIVTVQIENYPYLMDGTIPVTIQRIPNQNIYTPMTEPMLYFQNSLSVSGGSLSIPIPSFQDGDAYYIYLNPTLPIVSGIDIPPLADPGLSIFPNPFHDQATLQTGDMLKNATLRVYNSLGQLVKQMDHISGPSITFSRDDLSSGLYWVYLTQKNKTQTGRFVVSEN